MTGSTYHREILAVLLGAAVFLAFVIRGDKLRNGFILFVVMLGLGYRTAHITSALKIIPAELVLCILPFLAGRKPGNVGLPWWLVLMLPFWVIAWTTSQGLGSQFDVQFAEFRNFALAIPIFLVARSALRGEDAWRKVVLAFLALSVGISAMGLMEYFIPSIATLLPGFIADPTPHETEGFRRAAFSFYGSPIAVFICVMAWPLSLAAWRWWTTRPARAATILGVGLQFAAIYISGYRSMWLLVACQLMAFVVIRRRFGLGVVLVCAAIVGYGMLPEATRDRVQSLSRVLEGNPEEVDTSGQKRWERAREAYDSVFYAPMGMGWGAAGWVHSDFLQVAANQGVLAGAILLGGYLVALAQLFMRSFRHAEGSLAALGPGLAMSFLAVGGILLFEGVEFLPQTMLPVWFTWALVDTWLLQARPVAVKAKVQRLRLPQRIGTAHRPAWALRSSAT